MDQEVAAEIIKGQGWSGVKVIVPVGCYAERGRYVGMFDLPCALVGTAHRSVDIKASSQSETEFQEILHAFRFR